ncbi:MAG: hypothetical protein KAI33_06110 [Elusimicrobiales bacterium]|nr:hypothetical protein [Elusimicrobiales bacterium]MCK5583343.1 hypothetical protein [Elusimicrobiales bacterium]
MKKLEFIAKKTGLNSNEINKFSKFSVLGIIAILITTVMGCVKNNNQVKKPAAENMTLEEIKNLVKEVEAEKKPTGKKVKPDISDNCGPYPGYPCGTKYFTVAVKDFSGFCL